MACLVLIVSINATVQEMLAAVIKQIVGIIKID